MLRRKEIRNQVKDILEHNPSGDPHQKQMKHLEALGIISMLMLDETMDKMIDTNKALDESNKQLAKSNLKLQRIAIAISILALLVSFALGIVAIIPERSVKIEVNGKDIIQRTNK